MEVRDEFIISIFNYCDRWCETCPFTARCQLFADVAEREASLDPHMQVVVTASSPAEEHVPPPPGWLQEEIDRMNEASTMPDGECERLIDERRASAANEMVYQRSLDYATRVRLWRTKRRAAEWFEPPDPRAVIEWFHTLVPAKIHRALIGRAFDDLEDRDWPTDHDGSAKVALEGIDRSLVAWERLSAEGVLPLADAHDFITDLMWQRDELERLFPTARAFVRPGFDEPDEVAKLLASEKR